MKRLLLVTLVVAGLVSGCNNAGGPPAITVSVTSSASTVQAGGTLQITATVANDSANKGVTWSVTCSAVACGSVSPASTASGAATTYTAPSSPPPSDVTVTITATSVADGTKVGTVTITFKAVTISVAPSTAPVNAGSSTTITPTVTNDPSATVNVTWTVSCSTAPCGSVSPTTTASGTATTYTAPTTPPSSTLTVTVTATSATDTTKSASSTITVPAVSVSISPSAPTVLEGQTKVFTATVSGTSNQSVTWLLTCTAANCGSLTSNTSNPATYTAPGPPASTLTVTIKATAAADPTKSASTTITVPAIGVSVLPASASVVVSATANFTATVTNDPSASSSVNWTLSGTGCTGAACGTLSSSSSASGTPVVYTAPATVPTPATVTLTATSATDGTKTASATITITTAPPITASVSPNTASVVVNATQNFSATVTNDPTNSGVTWSLSGSGCSGSTCGTLSNVTTTSVTYTAPATVPTPATVTLTATSVRDTTKTGTATITVTAAPACVSMGSESLLNGHYAFLLKGFDNGTTPQPALVGGVLTFNGVNNNGLITAGTIDMNLAAGPSLNLTVTSGSYGVGSDQRGCMVITTSVGTQNYRFSLGNFSGGVASTGHMIDFDTTGPFTAGVLRKQDTTAFSITAVSGNYAFGVSSAQNTAHISNGVAGGKFGAAGVFDFSNGIVTGGTVDFNENGKLDGSTSNTTWPASPVPISSGGSYTIDMTSGRGTLTFTPSTPSPTHAVIYVVSSTEVLVLSSDPQANDSIFAGTALKQSAGPFFGSSVSGTYVGYSSALGGGAGTTSVNLFLVNIANPSISGTSFQNNGGSFSSGMIAATYTVDLTTGRTVTAGGGGNPPILYIVNSNQAFFLGPNSRVDSGFVESQTGGPFSTSSANGTFAFGTLDPQGASVSDNSGVATFTPATTSVTVTEDDNSKGSQTLGRTQSFTYSIDSTGLVRVPAGCTISATSTTCGTISFIISPTKAVVMDTGTMTPKVQLADK